VVNVFTREITDNLTSLVKKIEKVVADNGDKKMAAFVVHLTDDPDASEETLKKLAEKNKIVKTPLTNFDGLAGPPVYKIAEKADVTVMMWVGGKVKVNHALTKGELTEKKIAEIVADTAKILE
jgi:CTP:molybdopterin cytidylyltransferase MocA